VAAAFFHADLRVCSESLIFHPLAQSGATFRLVGRQRKSPGLLLVAYAQRPEEPKLAGRLQINEASAVILLQGMAWVDPSTYRIVRLWSDLLVPRSDFGIKSHITETEFHEVRFEHILHPFWLPSQVEVVVKWGGYTYANRHRYSDYKVFSVDAQDGEKKLAKP